MMFTKEYYSKYFHFHAIFSITVKPGDNIFVEPSKYHKVLNDSESTDLVSNAILTAR